MAQIHADTAKRADIPSTWRPTLLIIGGMAAVLFLGGVVALTVGRQSDASYPPHSPQSAVKTFVHLLQDRRVDEAYSVSNMTFDPGGMTRMSRDQFHQSFDGWGAKSHRVTFIRTDQKGNRASVITEVSAFSGGGLGPSDTTNQQTFTLVRRHGAWIVTGPSYLYP